MTTDAEGLAVEQRLNAFGSELRAAGGNDPHLLPTLAELNANMPVKKTVTVIGSGSIEGTVLSVFVNGDRPYAYISYITNAGDDVVAFAPSKVIKNCGEKLKAGDPVIIEVAPTNIEDLYEDLREDLKGRIDVLRDLLVKHVEPGMVTDVDEKKRWIREDDKHYPELLVKLLYEIGEGESLWEWDPDLKAPRRVVVVVRLEVHYDSPKGLWRLREVKDERGKTRRDHSLSETVNLVDDSLTQDGREELMKGKIDDLSTTALKTLDRTVRRAMTEEVMLEQNKFVHFLRAIRNEPQVSSNSYPGMPGTYYLIDCVAYAEFPDFDHDKVVRGMQGEVFLWEREIDNPSGSYYAFRPMEYPTPPHPQDVLDYKNHRCYRLKKEDKPREKCGDDGSDEKLLTEVEGWLDELRESEPEPPYGIRSQSDVRRVTASSNELAKSIARRQHAEAVKDAKKARALACLMLKEKSTDEIRNMLTEHSLDIDGEKEVMIERLLNEDENLNDVALVVLTGVESSNYGMLQRLIAAVGMFDLKELLKEGPACVGCGSKGVAYCTGNVCIGDKDKRVFFEGGVYSKKRLYQAFDKYVINHSTCFHKKRDYEAKIACPDDGGSRARQSLLRTDRTSPKRKFNFCKPRLIARFDLSSYSDKYELSATDCKEWIHDKYELSATDCKEWIHYRLTGQAEVSFYKSLILSDPNPNVKLVDHLGSPEKGCTVQGREGFRTGMEMLEKLHSFVEEETEYPDSRWMTQPLVTLLPAKEPDADDDADSKPLLMHLLSKRGNEVHSLLKKDGFTPEMDWDKISIGEKHRELKIGWEDDVPTPQSLPKLVWSPVGLVRSTDVEQQWTWNPVGNKDGFAPSILVEEPITALLRVFQAGYDQAIIRVDRWVPVDDEWKVDEIEKAIPPIDRVYGLTPPIGDDGVMYGKGVMSIRQLAAMWWKHCKKTHLKSVRHERRVLGVLERREFLNRIVPSIEAALRKE